MKGREVPPECTSESELSAGAGFPGYLDFPIPAFIWRLAKLNSTNRTYLNNPADSCQRSSLGICSHGLGKENRARNASYDMGTDCSL